MLMSEIKDCFISYLDDSDSGIQARVMALNNMLKIVDNELWQHL